VAEASDVPLALFTQRCFQHMAVVAFPGHVFASGDGATAFKTEQCTSTY